MPKTTDHLAAPANMVDVHSKISGDPVASRRSRRGKWEVASGAGTASPGERWRVDQEGSSWTISP